MNDSIVQMVSGGGTVALAVAVFMLQRDMSRAITQLTAMVAVLVDRGKEKTRVELAK